MDVQRLLGQGLTLRKLQQASEGDRCPNKDFKRETERLHYQKCGGGWRVIRKIALPK